MRARFFAQACVEASTVTTLVAIFATTVRVGVDRSTGLPSFPGIGSGRGGFRRNDRAAVVLPPAAPTH